MKHQFFKHALLRRGAAFKHRFSVGALPPLSLMLGILLAAAILSAAKWENITGFGDAIVSSDHEESLLSAYWKCSRYHILTALFSTSFLGAPAISALLAYKGFAMCCASAALIMDYADKGALLAAVQLGLPGLVVIPCLLIIASDSMRSSAELLSIRFGIRQRPPARYDMRRSLFCLGALIPVAVFQKQLLPELIFYIIN